MPDKIRMGRKLTIRTGLFKNRSDRPVSGGSPFPFGPPVRANKFENPEASISKPGFDVHRAGWTGPVPSRSLHGRPPQSAECALGRLVRDGHPCGRGPPGKCISGGQKPSRKDGPGRRRESHRSARPVCRVPLHSAAQRHRRGKASKASE